MRDNIPGVVIPDSIIRRLLGAGKRSRTEGKRICIEMVQQIEEIPGVSGVHIMAYRQEHLVPEILGESGLLPRPNLESIERAYVPDVDAVENGPKLGAPNPKDGLPAHLADALRGLAAVLHGDQFALYDIAFSFTLETIRSHHTDPQEIDPPRVPPP